MQLIRPAAVVVATGLALTACSAGGTAARSSARSVTAKPIAATQPTATDPATTHPPATTAAPATTRPTTPATAAPPTTAVPGGWRVVASGPQGPAIEQRTVYVPGGDTVVLLRFLAGRTLFRLHVGSTDPPGATASVPASAGPAVTAAERPLLLGAFNGGFKTDTYSGGVEAAGVTLVPLRVGEASLVIDSNGQARVAVWGSGTPRPGESVASVRQNLPPLISGGQPSSAVNVISAWGATLHGYSHVARSALGTDAAGNLVYAASSSAVPVDLSTALLDAGCVTAMELDINPYWVQADVAATPGAPLTAVVPGQNQPASRYLYGWTRDFVTVLAAP